jgi:hypothetical protein
MILRSIDGAVNPQDLKPQEIIGNQEVEPRKAIKLTAHRRFDSAVVHLPEGQSPSEPSALTKALVNLRSRLGLGPGWIHGFDPGTFDLRRVGPTVYGEALPEPLERGLETVETAAKVTGSKMAEAEALGIRGAIAWKEGDQANLHGKNPGPYYSKALEYFKQAAAIYSPGYNPYRDLYKQVSERAHRYHLAHPTSELTTMYRLRERLGNIRMGFDADPSKIDLTKVDLSRYGKDRKGSEVGEVEKLLRQIEASPGAPEMSGVRGEAAWVRGAIELQQGNKTAAQQYFLRAAEDDPANSVYYEAVARRVGG